MSDDKLIHKIESILQKPSKASLDAKYPSWDEVLKKSPNLEYFPTVNSTPVVSIFSSSKAKWIGGALLAAASIGFVFYSNQDKGHSEVTKVEVAEVLSNELLNGKTIAVKGEVVFVSDSDPSSITKVEKGMVLKSGDHLRTGKNGSIDLEFENQTWVRLANSSELKVLKIEKNQDSQFQKFEILSGKVFAQVSKLGKSSEFSFVSGTTETEVRGTNFSVRFVKGEVVVAVREGSVAVSNMVLEANEEISFSSDSQKPSQIVPLSEKENRELKAFQTQISLAKEAELYSEYSRLELVRLEDGTEYRGVILGQTETHLKFMHSTGLIEIPISKILETEKIR
ncbi:MAG: FecR family protein [Leptospira sp.]|nr:FecR family protein [Leptospira sp.]